MTTTGQFIPLLMDPSLAGYPTIDGLLTPQQVWNPTPQVKDKSPHYYWTGLDDMEPTGKGQITPLLLD